MEVSFVRPSKGHRAAHNTPEHRVAPAASELDALFPIGLILRQYTGFMSRRWRSLWLTVVVVGLVWAGAMAGFHAFRNSKMTAERVRAYAESQDLARLTGAQREKALRELARRLNSLSYEERRKARFDRVALDWFEHMTEEEKTWFVEETMPTGFKQMLGAFEEMPEERRKRAIDESLQRLREARTRLSLEEGRTGDTNSAPVSPELEARIRTIGLKTFYSQSSARTKAEVAPLLEEIQRSMESGRVFRGRRR